MARKKYAGGPEKIRSGQKLSKCLHEQATIAPHLTPLFFMGPLIEITEIIQYDGR
jgi:hypothetical protein